MNEFKLAVLQSKTPNDVSKGVWLELENEEYGWWLIDVAAQQELTAIERGRVYFHNNLRTFSTSYQSYKLTLWNNGTVDQSIEVPTIGELVMVPIAEPVVTNE